MDVRRSRMRMAWRQVRMMIRTEEVCEQCTEDEDHISIIPSICPSCTDCTTNLNFQIMQWHFMNSMRILCAPVSVTVAVHVTT
jgi:hypothetical protein